MTKRELASMNRFITYRQNRPIHSEETASTEPAEGYFSQGGMVVPHVPSNDIPFVLGMPALFHAVQAEFRPLKMGAFEDICSGFVVNRGLFETARRAGGLPPDCVEEIALCACPSDASIIAATLVDFCDRWREGRWRNDWNPNAILTFAAALKSAIDANKVSMLICDAPECEPFHDQALVEELAGNVIKLRALTLEKSGEIDELNKLWNLGAKRKQLPRFRGTSYAGVNLLWPRSFPNGAGRRAATWRSREC
jgi:hypothetical protein